MTDRAIIQIFKSDSFGSVQEMSQHLNILHTSSKFIPTHWAINERPTAKRKYVRGEVLFYGEDSGDYDGVHLYRQKAPGYTLYYESNAFFKPSVLRLSFEDAKNFDVDTIREIFELGTTFAHELEALFGYVWMSWYGDENTYLPIKSIRAGELARYGPNPVHARTWFGSHLKQLIGRDRFDQCGAYVRDTSWGGVELDLTPEPWTATLDELVDRQRQVMTVLGETEVFGNYQNFPIFQPGKNWVRWAS